MPNRPKPVRPQGLSRVPRLAAALALCLPSAGVAQSVDPLAARAEAFAGGEIESYLRVLQTLGASPVYPWTVRGFSPSEVERLAPGDDSHPWGGRLDLRADSAGGSRFALLRPQLAGTFNSAFAYGSNDGAVWAGRGVTSAVRAGFALRYGPASLVVAPVAFWTQNADFELFDNGLQGDLGFAAMRRPTGIDLPQRFGDRPYARLDPGQSTARIDAFGVAAGISTANQFWGPATAHPVLLGNNAAGFPHGFLGTASPLNLWIGKLHGRAVLGRLDPSSYATPTQSPRRLMSGLVASFSPRYPEGLEIGAARFFHSVWPEGGLTERDVLRPFEGIFKTGLHQAFGDDDELNLDNQLASVFVRWVLPGTGFEAYGEVGREDHPWDLRHMILRPDDSSSYLLGFRKAWARADERFLVVRGETLNTQPSHIWRFEAERFPQLYSHFAQRQGHTQRGQLLASGAAYGGGATTLAADLYHESGRWTVAWEREVRGVGNGTDREGGARDSGIDVMQSIGVEALRFLGRFEAVVGVDGVLSLNRNYSGEDVGNLRASVVLRTRF